MKLIEQLFLAFIVSIVSVAAYAEEPKAVSRPEDLGFAADRLEKVTKAFQGYVDSGQIPGAVVLIARKDKLAYFKAFGFRDREQKIAMATDSIFRIASMTKPIVSVAAMILAEEGKLDIAAPVARYIPEFRDLKVRTERADMPNGAKEVVLLPPVRPMTVQDLLRHTAGVVYPPPIGAGPVADLYRDAKIGDPDDTLAERIAKIAALPLAHQPGDVWEYSVATDVLARIVEVVSGVNLEGFLEERVIRPLGMTSTSYHVGQGDAARVAQPQLLQATGRRPPAFIDVTVKPKLIGGGGGMVSTALDYLRFCEMLLHDGQFAGVRLLSPSTVALMTSNALRPGIGYTAAMTRYMADFAPTPVMGQGFGLGFAVRTEIGQNPLPGSPGSFYWTGALGTSFFVDPKQQLVIIAMAQVPFPANDSYRRAVRYLAYQALVTAN